MAKFQVARAGIVGLTVACVVAMTVSASAQGNAEAAKLKNPVKSAPASIAAGKVAYGKYCKFCHGEDAKGNGPLAPKEDPKAGKNRRRGGDPICEAALFYEAECQREQKNYRTAVDTYTKLLYEFTNSEYTTRACQGLFQIADHWLMPTRRQMDEYQEQLQGKRTFVTPAMYFHMDKDMPFLDAEGHATAILNTVRLHNIKGPMAEKALPTTSRPSLIPTPAKPIPSPRVLLLAATS